MGCTYEKTKMFAKDNFKIQLNDFCKRCDIKARFMLPRSFVVNELNARIRQKEKREKLKQIPLIGKMIYKNRAITYHESKCEPEFILSLMDNLGLDYLNNDSLKYIVENQDEIYEKFYRKDYERMYAEREARYRESLWVN